MKKIKFFPHQEEFSQPFVPASKALPEWWRKTPSLFGGKEIRFDGQATNFTIKKCVPFLDSLTTGYMVILQDDVIVQDASSKEDVNLMWKNSERVVVTSHTPEQWGEFPFPNNFVNHIFKWHNVWSIETPRGYSVSVGHPPNRFDLPFLTLSGMVDTDMYKTPIQFPFIIQKDFRGVIQAGTPIAHINIVKRESWKAEHLNFDFAKAAKASTNFFSAIHSHYRKNSWIKKEYR